jgi:hypothetical protein
MRRQVGDNFILKGTFGGGIGHGLVSGALIAVSAARHFLMTAGKWEGCYNIMLPTRISSSAWPAAFRNRPTLP